MSLVVVGSDSISLAMATHYALRELPVAFYDTDGRRAEKIARQECPDPEEPELEHRLAEAQRRGLFYVATDLTAACRDARLIVIFTAVRGTANGADCSELEAVTAAVGRGLQAGAIVCFEVRVAVGEVRRRLGPLLERSSGLRVGEEFYVVVSPPRYTRGHVFADIPRNPKVVGAWNEVSMQRASEFYLRTADTILAPATSLEAAEFIGLAEHANREMNAGFVHELAERSARCGLDLEEILMLANTQPFFPLFRPGIQGLSDDVATAAQLLAQDGQSPLLDLARRTNDTLPFKLILRLDQTLGGLKGRLVEVILDHDQEARGASIRVARVMEELRLQGAKLCFARMLASGLEASTQANRAEALVIGTDRLAWHQLESSAYPACTVLLDLTNSLRRRAVEGAGWRYLGVGA